RTVAQRMQAVGDDVVKLDPPAAGPRRRRRHVDVDTIDVDGNLMRVQRGDAQALAEQWQKGDAAAGASGLRLPDGAADMATRTPVPQPRLARPQGQATAPVEAEPVRLAVDQRRAERGIEDG